MGSNQVGAAAIHSASLHAPVLFLETQLRDTLPRNSNTACQRCREQKLRCSRNRPACSRCYRQRLTCSYPLPPNRKLIATSRKTSRLRGPEPPTQKRTVQTAQDGDSFSYSGRSQPLVEGVQIGDGRHIQPLDNASDASDAGLACEFDEQTSLIPQKRPLLPSQEPGEASEPFASGRLAEDVNSISNSAVLSRSSHESSAGSLALLPPRAIGLSLLEIYFDRVYNASLLFYKPALFSDYLDDKLPSFLLRSVFALASLFLRKTNTQRHAGGAASELSALSLFYRNGRHWAQAASQEVLALADQPSLITTQSLQCLTLYWFADGQIDRADIHLTLAYRSCCILKYNQLSDYDRAPTSVLAMDHELKRRCFWACWASCCIASELTANATSVWSAVADLPLPGTFLRSGCKLDIAVSQNMDANWRCSTRGQNSKEYNGSIWGEFMKILGVWVKIQVFATESPSYSDDRLVHGIESLSRNLKSICQLETFSRWMTNGSITDDMRELRVLLTSVCHVCHIILHASVVPLFSGRPLNAALTRASTRFSGDIIFSHATEMGRLLQEYLSTGPDLTKLSPLVGFVAFIAGSVLVISARVRIYRNTNDRIQPPAVDSILIEACLATLGTLRTYWMPLQSPWDKLSSAVNEIKRTVPLSRNRPESCLSNDQDRCQPALNTTLPEEQADASFIRTGYCSTSRGDAIPRAECGNRHLSGTKNSQSTDSSTFHSEISMVEQMACQDRLLADGSTAQLPTKEYSMGCKEPIAESVSDNYLLEFLFANSWEGGEEFPPYEPLLPLEQQFY